MELEESLGLDLYEMDARMYDQSIGRFNGINPVTHFSQGTSVAFDNNPIYWADPSGADSENMEDFISDLWNRSNDDGYAYTYDGNGSLTGVTSAASIGIVSSKGANLQIKSIDRSKGRKIGYRTLYPMTILNAGGEERSAWVASRVTSTGYRDDYYIGPKKLAEFTKIKGSYAAMASWDSWAVNHGSVWGGYASTWNVQNVLSGLSVGFGGALALNFRRGGMSINAGYGNATLPMKFEKSLPKGIKISDVVNEMKAMTWASGNEHAAARLANGQRAIVSGGPRGIYFEYGQIRVIYGHTHPGNLPPSAGAYNFHKEYIFTGGRVGQSRQYIFHGGQRTMIRPN